MVSVLMVQGQCADHCSVQRRALGSDSGGRQEIPWGARRNLNRMTIHVTIDGNQYCAMLGTDLVIGLGGFGDTIPDALRDLAKAMEGHPEDLDRWNDLGPIRPDNRGLMRVK